MYKNIVSNYIEFNDDFTVFAPLFNSAGGNNIEHDRDSLINHHDAQSNLNNISNTTADSETNSEAVAMNNHNSLCTGSGHDNVVGVSNAVASSNAIASTETRSISEDMFLGSAISDSDAIVEALAIGIDNIGKIDTGKGNDTVVGVANASATAVSEALSQAELVFDYVSNGEVNALSEATADVLASGVGISNLGKIHTGLGHDTVIGIANVSAMATSSAFSLGESVSANNSVAIANSESVSIVEALAIGIDNSDKIATGKGHDVIVGIASTLTMTEADAVALTNSVAVSPEFDGDAANVLQIAISQSTSAAIADSFTTTLGIINSGKIDTGAGSDVIFGLANNESVSNSQAFSEAVATANNIADANADVRSLAIANGSAVGIANLGKIHTGSGNDTIIGVALNNSAADAGADANAEAFADVSDSVVDTDVIADTSKAIAIGIDNEDGKIETGHGGDQIIGYGEVGIVGGRISTGKGHDRVIGYGTSVGIEGGEISLGDGNDYFKAMIADFDPLTGKVCLKDDLSSSIKDAVVFGGHGNDTFKLGGFAGTVSIDGGKDRDVLKLWGSVDDYKFTLGSSGVLTIENSDSELVVKNVEELYFGNSDRSYSFHDFA